MLTFDTETCGLHGMAVFLQYQIDKGEIHLCDLWKMQVGDVLELLEMVAAHEVCGFNLAFDWFHISKLYTTFTLFAQEYGNGAIPEDYIEEIADLEERARFLDLCIKPRAAMDLMLHSRKGPYQSLMARHDIKIKNVPSLLAPALAAELEKRVEIDGIYFSRRKDTYSPQWQVYPTDRPDFKNVVLKFNASGALKVLAEHALGYSKDNILRFTDIEVPKRYRPAEYGWAPFAKAVSSASKNWIAPAKRSGKTKKKFAWPKLIKEHINHWAYYQPARKYGQNDVKYTQELWEYFGHPEPGDDDSELACMVGCVRWHGFRLDLKKIRELRNEALTRELNVPTAPRAARAYLEEVLDETEIGQLDGTGRIILEGISEWQCDCSEEFEDDNDGMGHLASLGIDFGNQQPETSIADCPRCGGVGKHPAAERATKILRRRKADKEVELYDKLLTANRFHASFKVIGTLSSRMSGTDGLNAQAINRQFKVRDAFTLSDDGFILCGGDFDAFEVVLADAAYNDPALREVLLAGKKIHALFAMEIFPGKTYQDILDTKDTERDLYSIGKAGIFALVYGGDWNTLVNKNGIPEEIAKRAYENFILKYPGIEKARQKIFEMFCSMRQPAGLGSRVIWRDPAEYIESLLGFRRYFSLENKICKALFDLANNPPPAWRKFKVSCERHAGREQTVFGASSSALYGAAFAIQAANMRAAANHVIQSSGATITKAVQRNVWDQQPCGVSEFRVIPMNVHDEVACPCKPQYAEQVEQIVNDTVEMFRPQVPLIKMDWTKGAASWGQMK